MFGSQLLKMCSYLFNRVFSLNSLYEHFKWTYNFMFLMKNSDLNIVPVWRGWLVLGFPDWCDFLHFNLMNNTGFW